MKFAAFYTSDGTVRYVSTYLEGEPPPVEPAWIEVSGPISADSGRVHEGQWVPYSTEGAARKKSPPPYPAQWNPTDEVWVDLRAPEERLAQQWANVRTQRNQLLLDTDWTDTLSAAARLGQTLYDAWQTYRQALRDVPEQPDPFNITWPQPPN